ncbi:MAG: glycosyltransferase family 2 protein [Selenomonadaceae bacterium]|nr:glycosyltransferase family 2 protein [Selenomonadaceae bacterium]
MNPKLPKISIIVPMYNSENFIETCIESILYQSFRDFELLIIDDKSTDASYGLVREKYCNPKSNNFDGRIKIFRRTKNFGESSTRNFGLDLACGDYVFFMDDDDAILEKTLETFYVEAKKSDADIVCMNSHFSSLDPNFSFPGEINIIKRLCNRNQPRFLSTNLVERLQEEFIDFGIFVNIWTKLYRRKFLVENEIYFPNVKRNGDFLFNFATLCLSKKFQVINDCGYIFRTGHLKSMTKVSSEQNLHSAIQSLSTAVNFMEEILAKKILSPISRANQVICQAHMVKEMFHGLVVNSAYCGDNELPISKIDLILKEMSRENSMHDPEVMRVMTHTLALVMNYFFNLSLERDRVFELER